MYLQVEKEKIKRQYCIFNWKVCQASVQPFSWHSEEGGEQKVNISQEEQSQPKNYKYKNNNNNDIGTITITI